VSYVSPRAHDIVLDIEEREKAGTPAVLQTLKAALAFMVKEAVGIPEIEAREKELLEKALKRWGGNPAIEVLGKADAEKQIGILSFNVRQPNGRYLHPRFVTVLLNDLFGIQSRAGCSCAGPYGHTLLGIDEERSERYRSSILAGYTGLKPGWCRVGFHYTMDDAEADYLIDAVDFVARRGATFMADYTFDLESSSWEHKTGESTWEELCLDQALKTGCEPCRELEGEIRSRLYHDYLREAEELADRLDEQPAELRQLDGELGQLQFFDMPAKG
jgi:hypothetical protein